MYIKCGEMLHSGWLEGPKAVSLLYGDVVENYNLPD